MNSERNRRIMVIDDQVAIHNDFRKILGVENQPKHLSRLEHTLFGHNPQQSQSIRFEIDSAYQGQDGLARAEQALKEGRPYALAFIDVRMPPGWDGVETATRIWQVCPDLQVVIATAYTDYSWQDMMQKLGTADRWVILKKPFDNIEVLQLASALTEKWNLNQQARLKMSELGVMVEERTRDLKATHERLLKETEQRMRMEEEAEKMESVGQLAAGVAHHFNNLLQIIMGNSGLLLADGGLRPDQCQALRDIENTSRRAGSLTYQLLAFSRRQLMRAKWIDLNETIVNALEHLKPELNAIIKIKFTPASNLPKIPADAAMLGQVFTILARNAQEAMKRGGELSIRTELVTMDAAKLDHNPEARPGKYTCLSVADTGIGIDEATMKRLFEPFFTTKGLAQGVGLGLATAFGIVKQHHGWIQVNTKVNAGTTFRVYLPVIAESAPAPGPPPAARG
jgi:signal transduction histidine kinase